MSGKRRDLTQLSHEQKAGLLAQIQKGQQLGGHFPDEEDLDRVQRLLNGDFTLDEAYAELDAEFGVPEERGDG